MLPIYRSPRFRQYAVVLIVNLTIFTTGMSVSWPSPMVVKLRNATETPLHRPITEEEGSWIVSVGALCTMIVLSPLGTLLDRMGRKYCVIISCIPKVIGSIMFIFAKDVWVLILGRAIVGAADYFLFTVVPVFASEIADKEVRGALGTILQILSSTGIALTMSFGPFVSYHTYSIVFAALNVLVSIPIFFLDDSPYYLYTKGKINEAMNVLITLRGSEYLAKEELESYAISMNTKKVDKIQLLKNLTVLKSMGIAAVLCMISQFIGFNAVSYNLQTILESTQTNVMPEVASLIISLIQLLAAMCSSVINDRVKRKNILIYSLVGVLIGLIGLGAFFKIREIRQEVVGFMNYLPIISLILIIFCYSAGIGSLFWVLVPELFDGPARAFGTTFAMVVVALCIFITTKFFSALTLAIGPAFTYWLFSIVCVFSAVFVYFCIPDTTGKSFNEIQESLGAEKKA